VRLDRFGRRGHVPEFGPSAESSDSPSCDTSPRSGVAVPSSEQSECWLKLRLSRAVEDEREMDGLPTSTLASLSLSERAGLEPPPLRGQGARVYVRLPCPRCCHVAARWWRCSVTAVGTASAAEGAFGEAAVGSVVVGSAWAAAAELSTPPIPTRRFSPSTTGTACSTLGLYQRGSRVRAGAKIGIDNTRCDFARSRACSSRDDCMPDEAGMNRKWGDF